MIGISERGIAFNKIHSINTPLMSLVYFGTITGRKDFPQISGSISPQSVFIDLKIQFQNYGTLVTSKLTHCTL